MNLGIIRSRPWRAFRRVERTDAIREVAPGKLIPTMLSEALTELARRGAITPDMQIKEVHWIVLKELGLADHPPFGLKSPETVRIALRRIKGFER